jgi:hypothetical protein
MAYGVKYRFEFYSKINNLLNRIDILENAFAGDITTLESMGTVPIRIRWDGGDFEKDSSIVASEAVLEFVQTETFDIDTFFSNTDQKYKINHYVNSVLNWTGFVQTSDLQQPYQDPPNIFTVRAVDGLAFLKTINLQDENGDGIRGLEKIMYFCQRCLAKTGHELNINNWINIFPYENYGTGSLSEREFNANIDPFNLSSIFGESFMTGKEQWDNSYNVLSKIMYAFQARCFQWEGEWHFVRTEDYIYYNDLLTSSEWEFDGVFPISFSAVTFEKDFSVEIDRDATVKQVNRSVLEGRKRAVKSTKLTYVFNSWPQMVANDRFLKGTFSSPNSTTYRQAYVLDDWTTIVGRPVFGIWELTNTFQIEQTYMQLDRVADGGIVANMGQAVSTAIPVQAGDKLSIFFRTRETTSSAATGQGVVILRLIDGAGNFYTINNAGQFGPANIVRTFGYTWGSSQDRRNWQDYTVETEGFPEAGYMYLEIYSAQYNQVGNQVHYKDLELTMTNYIYDSVVAAGQTDFLENDDNIIDRYDESMELCNVPVPTYQGWVGGTVSNVLTPHTNWFHAGVDEQIPFIRIVNTGFFRSLYRAYYTLDGSFVGIVWDDVGTQRVIGLINSFYLAGSDKRYISSSMEIEYKGEIVNTQLIELFIKDGADDTADGDLKQFRYLDEKDTFQEPPFQQRKTLWQKLEGSLGKGTISRIISIFKK